ncbi:hypothetical protein ALC57_05447 [Trachymyrmex cornetzi]|uniref:Uncharacterized protein n=1 Tax=Trachymyrmex cornetzi TaxID=471704 RepID=A0A195EAC6_9HYME|nr:hypothetical protein ALC57_05447 [Trachymyrmex cornetzi]
MPGNTLTLSTDDGEQAGEENDRMAPHHLFSPSFPPRGYFHPAVLQLVFTFLVSCRTRSQLYRIYLAKTPVGTSRRSSTVGGSDIDTDRFADENDENPGRDSRDADSQSPYGQPIKSRGTHIRRRRGRPFQRDGTLNVQSTTRVIAPFDEPGCQQEYALDPPCIGSDALGAAVFPVDRNFYSLQPHSTTCAKLAV